MNLEENSSSYPRKWLKPNLNNIEKLFFYQIVLLFESGNLGNINSFKQIYKIVFIHKLNILIMFLFYDSTANLQK